MDEPIISPLLVYVVFSADYVKMVAATCSIVFGIVWIIAALNQASDMLYGTEEEKKAIKSEYKRYRFVRIIGTISIVAFIAVPSSNTLIAMVVAKKITPRTLQQSCDEGKNLHEKIRQEILDVLKR